MSAGRRGPCSCGAQLSKALRGGMRGHVRSTRTRVRCSRHRWCTRQPMPPSLGDRTAHCSGNTTCTFSFPPPYPPLSLSPSLFSLPYLAFPSICLPRTLSFSAPSPTPHPFFHPHSPCRPPASPSSVSMASGSTTRRSPSCPTHWETSTIGCLSGSPTRHLTSLRQ